MARKFSFFSRTSNKKKVDGTNGEYCNILSSNNLGMKGLTRKTSLPNHIEKLENHGEKCEEFECQRRSSTKDEAIWFQHGKRVNR